ncbi:MAG: hypothetical protein K0S30_2249 [Clostridia bacterium]|jgi:uncharacterized protein YaiI (UPF0178 family)|nr:hypothetical protein [Clostridia bacterium]
MRILIDADACPVVDLAIDIARQFDIEVEIFCDTSHVIEKKGIHTTVTPKGTDAVDFVLVNKVMSGDIIITQDYGLAAMALSKKGYPINQNGLIYSKDNIEQLLFTRHLSKEIRNKGGRTKGPKKREKLDDLHFSKALTTLISEVLNTL